MFPFIVAAPRFFSGAIQLGELMQIASAFGRVQDSLSWLVDNYDRLAAWQATTNRLTSYWDHPFVGRPATATMGLTGSAGVYAGWSRCAAHGSGGFAIYRPEHWSVKDSGLGYGDVLGAASKIFAYEVDGIDYTMTHGLPFIREYFMGKPGAPQWSIDFDEWAREALERAGRVADFIELGEHGAGAPVVFAAIIGTGTGAGIAADFATIGIGTETDGSITCPSSFHAVVGLKPTVGVVSTVGVVPLSAP